MKNLMVRIHPSAHALLKGLSRRSGQSMSTILTRAIEVFRRQEILAASNKAYAALREDRKAWAEEEAERKAWDATIGDGMEKE